MCGLFGMAGPGVCAEDLVFIREVAYLSGLRGLDSTGVYQAAVHKRSLRETLVKSQSEVSYFLWYHENHKDGDSNILANVHDNLFMGHCRAATKGKVSDENAHPFDVGNIVGAHNGTLYDSKYQDKEKTDSELMFRDIEERGLDAVLRDLDKGSAYAISMFSRDTGEMTFVRNDKRSLCYCFHNKRRVMYWASEGPALAYIAGRQNYGMGIDIGKIYRFSENVIYTFHPLEVNAGKLPDFTTRLIIPNHKKEEEKIPLITHQTKERENLNNVLTAEFGKKPLNLNLRKNVPEKEGLISPCIYCKKPLNLLQQWEGVEIETGGYICRPCDNINQKLLNEHLKKHSPTKGLMH